MKFNQVTPPLTSSPRFIEELISMLRGILGNLAALFDKGISFSDNTDSKTVSGTSNAIANTESSFSHGLSRVPTGFIVVSLDKGAVLYNGASANTTTLIYLKSTVASTAFTVLVF